MEDLVRMFEELGKALVEASPVIIAQGIEMKFITSVIILIQITLGLTIGISMLFFVYRHFKRLRTVIAVLYKEEQDANLIRYNDVPDYREKHWERYAWYFEEAIRYRSSPIRFKDIAYWHIGMLIFFGVVGAILSVLAFFSVFNTDVWLGVFRPDIALYKELYEIFLPPR